MLPTTIRADMSHYHKEENIFLTNGARERNRQIS